MKRILLILVLVCAWVCTQAQANEEAYVWSRDVVRTVSMRMDTSPGKPKILQEHPGKHLSELLLDAIKSRKLKCYKYYSGVDTVFLDDAYLQKLGTLGPDTVIIDSPAAPKGYYLKITPQVYDYNAVNKFQLFEHWRYNPITRHTRISIESVTAIEDSFDSKGNYIKRKNLPHVKWRDMLPLLSEYAKYDRKNTISNLIWEDYFFDSTMVDDTLSIASNDQSGKVWKRKVMERTELNECIPNLDNFLFVKLYDPSGNRKPAWDLFKIAEKPSVRVFRNFMLLPNDTISHAELKDLTKGTYDTFTVVDPIDGKETTNIMHRGMSFEFMCEFRISEEWAFEHSSGTTEISFKAIAPVHTVYDDGGHHSSKPLFWVQLKDAEHTLNVFRQNNSLDNMDINLWESRFKVRRRKNSESVNYRKSNRSNGVSDIFIPWFYPDVFDNKD